VLVVLLWVYVVVVGGRSGVGWCGRSKPRSHYRRSCFSRSLPIARALSLYLCPSLWFCLCVCLLLSLSLSLSLSLVLSRALSLLSLSLSLRSFFLSLSLAVSLSLSFKLIKERYILYKLDNEHDTVSEIG
jgi:hypothetical protein